MVIVSSLEYEKVGLPRPPLKKCGTANLLQFIAGHAQNPSQPKVVFQVSSGAPSLHVDMPDDSDELLCAGPGRQRPFKTLVADPL